MECKDGLHNCSQICIELQGEYSCACYGGYELLEDGVSCKGIIENHIQYVLHKLLLCITNLCKMACIFVHVCDYNVIKYSSVFNSRGR